MKTKNKMSNTKFYVGQKVYDSALFPGVDGEVIDIDNLTVIVRFAGNKKHYYRTGQLMSDAAPTLFPEPYEVKRPEVLPEPGTFGYCWDGDVEKPSSSSVGYFTEKVVNEYWIKMPNGMLMIWDHISTENPFPKKIEL